MNKNWIVGDSKLILPTLDKSSVDLIITDPPYNLERNLQRFYHREFCRICKGSILVFCSPENQWKFSGVKYLFWIKPTSTKNYSKNYGRFVEMICYYPRNGVWNKDLLWANYTGVYTDYVIGRTEHPHEKPESLIERFINIHSNPGDIILDPFAGSGTVARVAERLGRKTISIECQDW